MRILALLFAMLASSVPAFSDSLVLRSGMVGGEKWGGLSFGVDYLHSERGRVPVLISYDEAVNLAGIFSWSSPEPIELNHLAALVFSRPVQERSSLFAGAGVAWVGRSGGRESRHPLLRLTLTSDPNKLLVGQIRLSATAPVGLLADLSLGFAF